MDLFGMGPSILRDAPIGCDGAMMTCPPGPAPGRREGKPTLVGLVDGASDDEKRDLSVALIFLREFGRDRMLSGLLGKRPPAGAEDDPAHAQIRRIADRLIRARERFRRASVRYDRLRDRLEAASGGALTKADDARLDAWWDAKCKPPLFRADDAFMALGYALQALGFDGLHYRGTFFLPRFASDTTHDIGRGESIADPATVLHLAL